MFIRKVFLRKLENKSALEVVKALRGIKNEFDHIEKPIKSIVTDLGLEYNNQYFNNLFYGIKDKIFRKNDEIFNSAMAIVDRVMRTFRLIFKRFFVIEIHFIGLNFYRILRRIIIILFIQVPLNNYQMTFFMEGPPFFEYTEPVEKLPIGSSVRIRTINKKNIFDKKYITLWTDEIYV